jgi:hypothetical protein
MERWLKPVEAVASDPVKDETRLVAVKAEMAKVWDATMTRDEMLKHAEEWLAFTAPVEVRGCMLREELHPLMVEVYREKHPEDFEVKALDPIGAVGGLGDEEPK